MDPSHPSIPGPQKADFKKWEAAGKKHLAELQKHVGQGGWSVEIEGDIKALAQKAKYDSGGIVIWDYSKRMGEVVSEFYLQSIAKMFEPSKYNTSDDIKKAFLDATANRKIILRPMFEEGSEDYTNPHQRVSFENGNMIVSFTAEHFGVNASDDLAFCQLENIDSIWG